MINILSLGAGVQSSVVLLMSCRGELPKVDLAIFADTQWEPPEVYTHLKWLEVEAAKAGVPVVRVTAGNIRKDAMEKQVHNGERGRFAAMPLRVLNTDSGEGMLRRQCTREYKVMPITRYIKEELLGYKRGARMPKEPVVTQWFGISIDEPQRMRTSHEKWITNQYPLIGFPDEMLDRPMSRLACHAWFDKRYPGRELVKSACVGCPYHTNHEWLRVKADKATWEDAVDFDKRIRNMVGLEGKAYLHRSLKPLDEVTLEDPDQLDLFEGECEGLCGV